MSSVYLIALLSAAFYGAGDFVGGLASRRASALVILVISQLGGLIALVPVVWLVGGDTPATGDLLWGAAAGIAGGTGVALLYRGLAVGTMAIVAPISAALAVIVPVGVDLALGTDLGIQVVVGIGLALLAIVLVSQARAETTRGPQVVPAGVMLAIWSGLAIGMFFLLLARTSPNAGLWPLASARSTSVVFFAVLAMTRGESLRLPRRLSMMAIGGGVLDMLANALYLYASQRGALSIVVTLASLYPASTVLLARVFLHERLTRLQLVGVLVTLVAIALIASGA